jgi:hypothetical protein
MQIGQIVQARVNGGQWCHAQVIAIYDDIATVAGMEEIAISNSQGRKPLGICLKINLIRANK